MTALAMNFRSIDVIDCTSSSPSAQPVARRYSLYLLADVPVIQCHRDRQGAVVLVFAGRSDGLVKTIDDFIVRLRQVRLHVHT